MPKSQPEKLNLFKERKHEYAQPKTPKLVEMGEAAYIAVDGKGGPGEDLFQERVAALYGMAYTLKFQSKDVGRDYVVGKLEGLYGIDRPATEWGTLDRDGWTWRLLMRVPDFTTDADLGAARAALRDKEKPGDFDAVRFECIDEGHCVQCLHVGPYENESDTIALMDAYCEAHSLTPHRWHHEVYLSDPRRVPPDRLKTILRHPV